MTNRGDSKQAEKTYLSRSGGSAWEREKPFPPEGTDLFEESLELLNDFIVATRLLQPSKADRIVDLGAGGGWCSDLLQRLNRQSVAVDISLEMLRVSRERPTRAPIKAVAGDVEHLPFVDSSFDKAVCLSAIHHVPDMGSALREIHRVLAPDGVVVFSEPGVGHADKPWSVSASRDFGVLEQDILIDPFMDLCRASGFREVVICPMAYVIPEFELSQEDWRRWQRLPRVKRPYRALEKMARAAAEFAGLGKTSMLFEEAFAMRLVRLLQVPVEEHPFILAAKSEVRRRYRPTYRATIHLEAVPSRAIAAETVTAVVTITNVGTATWRADGAPGTGHVRLGIQLLDGTLQVIERDFTRARLARDVAPGESCRVEATFAAPGHGGAYGLKFDLVAEGLAWFEPAGTTAVVRRFDVDAT